MCVKWGEKIKTEVMSLSKKKKKPAAQDIFKNFLCITWASHFA